MRFVDEAVITIRSGKGGNGCVSFRRESFIPKGGPNGGDGGRGGDVLFRASTALLTLYDFRHKRLHKAGNGQPGEGQEKSGRGGEDLVIEVPVGTLIYELPDEGEPILLADLDEPGKSLPAAKGGRGGKGNTHFKSATMRTPRFAQPGEPAEEKRIRLELKLLAHAGIIGLPNAGKSTLISAVSAARPKVAPYPFTTLAPNLGVIYDEMGEMMILADIPGLIEGAHEGRGLGDRFLRHVDRTRFLVHLLSVEDADADDPWRGFDLVNAELVKFDPELAGRPQIEVVNKIDLRPEEDVHRLRERARADGRRVFFISALHGLGLEELVAAMWATLARCAAAAADGGGPAGEREEA